MGSQRGKEVEKTPRSRPEPKSMDMYRFFDAKDRLLYVGISLNAARRASDHKGTKAWWSEVKRMEVQHLDCDRAEALEIEREAIIRERPLHNVTHNSAEEAASSVPTESGGLCGHYVTTPRDDLGGFPNIQYQGYVKQQISPGFYLVAWFSWLDGCECERELVAIERMLAWHFYEDREDFMRAINKHHDADRFRPEYWPDDTPEYVTVVEPVLNVVRPGPLGVTIHIDRRTT